MTGGRWMVRGRVVTSGTVVDDGWVVVDGDRIVDTGRGSGPDHAMKVVADLGGAVVAPGFVDLHVHGGGGRQVAGETPEEVADAVGHLARHHLAHGTTSLVPTTVSDTPARLLAAVRGIALAMAGPAPAGRGAAGPTVLGAHLEGPWLAPGRAGAHAPGQLRSPDGAELAALVAAAPGVVRIVTFAPELDGSAGLLRVGLAAGVVMSVGHTEADADIAAWAFAAGARHVTHLGNAMPGIDRRDPGVMAAALADRRVTLEVIADGIHVHPRFLAMVGALAPDRLVAVTDATAACGMPPGSYRLGAAEVLVDAERVVLAAAPATLAGSVVTMDRAVATLVSSGVDLATAITAATATPAAVVSASGKGHLRAGADADLVVLGDDLRALATVIGGRVVSDPRGLLAAVDPATA